MDAAAHAQHAALTRQHHAAAPESLTALHCHPQGAVCTGIWVIAHECGHGAFSDYTWLNDLVGLVAHSCLLVPYYSW